MLKRSIAIAAGFACAVLLLPSPGAGAAVAAADEITQTGTSNDPPKENAPCFDGTGRWLKFTTGGAGENKTAVEVGSPDSPTMTYDEVRGSTGDPVLIIHSLKIAGVATAFSEVWVYPGGALASTFVFAPPVMKTAPKALAPRRGENITQVFLCAVVVVVPPGPCPGGEYLWINPANSGLVLAFDFVPLNGSEFIDWLGINVPAGLLTVVSYTSSDSGPNRIIQAQPNERWRINVGAGPADANGIHSGGTWTAWTPDLPDNVLSASITGAFPPVTTPGGNLAFEHWSHGTGDFSSVNSVRPDSICFRVD